MSSVLLCRDTKHANTWACIHVPGHGYSSLCISLNSCCQLDACKSTILHRYIYCVHQDVAYSLLSIFHAFSSTHAKNLQTTLPSSRWCQWHSAQRPHQTLHHPLLMSWFHNAFDPSCRSQVLATTKQICMYKTPQVRSSPELKSSLLEHVKSLTAVCKWTASD